MVRVVYQFHRAWIMCGHGAGFLWASMLRPANDNHPVDRIHLTET